MARAAWLPGRRLSEVVANRSLVSVSGASNKGTVGAVIEQYFGIRPNSDPRPDFHRATIELKTVPLRPRDSKIVPKERTFISMIDYHALPAEEWATAAVRKKLGRILFVYYGWVPDRPMSEFVVSDVVLWDPKESAHERMRVDWEVVRDLVRAGRAEHISESMGTLLAAATKGPGGPPTKSQPFSTALAQPRGWALRPAFTATVLADFRRIKGRLGLVRAAPPTDAEQRAISILMGLVGHRFGDVARAHGIKPSKEKNRAANVIRKVVRTSWKDALKELEAVGLQLRVVPVDAHGSPYESMSFPAFRYQELIREEWPDSELRQSLDRFLIVPLEGGKGLDNLDETVIRRCFIWAPDDGEIDQIGREWTMFRDQIIAGRALSLTPESETKILHVRPHGRDRLDSDPAPIVGPVVKKSFWINKGYVGSVIRRHAPDFRSRQA
jgi:DNA mismatch repair endonuclease MutH